MKTNVLCKVGRDLIGQGAAEEILLYPTGGIRITFTKSGSTITTKTGTLHKDGLDSVRAVSDAAGLAAERTSYRPYGEEVAQLQPVTLPETKGFIGERFDDQSCLQYLNARYYDPKLAMFIQPDWWEVMKEGVGANRYSYSFGDPINGKDPTGHQGMADVGGSAFARLYNELGEDGYEQFLEGYAVGGGVAGAIAVTVMAPELAGGLATRYPGAYGFLSQLGLNEATGMTLGAGTVGTLAKVAAVTTGKPQLTSGPNGIAHVNASMELAARIVEKYGINNIARISFNQRISSVVSGVKSSSQPDVTAVLKNGTVIVGEVASPSQSLASQLTKANDVAAAVGNVTGKPAFGVATDLGNGGGSVARKTSSAKPSGGGGIIDKIKGFFGL